MNSLEQLCKGAYDVRIQVGMLESEEKNAVLLDAAESLIAHTSDILEANAMDIENGKSNHMLQVY